MKKYIKAIAAIAVVFASVSGAEMFNLASPDGKLAAEIDVTNKFSISAKFNGAQFVKNATVYVPTNRYTYYNGLPYSLDHRYYRGDDPSEDFNQLEFSYTNNGYKVYVRVYNDALAFRVEVKNHPRVEKIVNEFVEIPSRGTRHCADLPLLFSLDNNVYAAFVEGNVGAYPQFKVKYDSKKKVFVSDFKKIKNSDEFESDYIYDLDGKGGFLPWRAFVPAYGYADPQIKNVKARLDKATTNK